MEKPNRDGTSGKETRTRRNWNWEETNLFIKWWDRDFWKFDEKFVVLNRHTGRNFKRFRRINYKNLAYSCRKFFLHLATMWLTEYLDTIVIQNFTVLTLNLAKYNPVFITCIARIYKTNIMNGASPWSDSTIIIFCRRKKKK